MNSHSAFRSREAHKARHQRAFQIMLYFKIAGVILIPISHLAIVLVGVVTRMKQSDLLMKDEILLVVIA